MDEYYIYRIINIVNNHDYIGKKKRLKTIEPLFDNYFGSGVLIKKAIQKYGIQNFRKEILENGLSFEDALLREVFWISKYKKENKAYYNISPGLEVIHNDKKEFIDKETLITYNKYLSEKIKDNWTNMTEEEYNDRTSSMKDAWSNMSPDKKERFSNNKSEIQKNIYLKMSEEKKLVISNKRKTSLIKMHEDRPLDYQKEINNKISQSLKEYNKSLSLDKKKEISKVLSEAQKEYLKTETEEHRKQRSINQSLAQGKYYKLKDSNNQEFIIKSLCFWCKCTFGDKWNSANTSLKKRGQYKGYYLLGEVPIEEIKDNVMFNDYPYGGSTL